MKTTFWFDKQGLSIKKTVKQVGKINSTDILRKGDKVGKGLEKTLKKHEQSRV